MTKLISAERRKLKENPISNTDHRKKLIPLRDKKYTYRKIIGFDIETNAIDKSNDFVMAHLYGDDHDVSFYDSNKLWDYFSTNVRLAKNYMIYATQLEFDFLGSFFDKPKDKWSLMERNGNIYSFTIKVPNGYAGREKRTAHLEFRDTRKITPIGVAGLGKIVGIPKMEHPKAFGRVPENHSEWQELREYCRNDAKISYTFIKNILQPFLKTNNLKQSLTAGSIALSHYRTHYLNKIWQVQDYNILEKEFSSYFGGRTEVFKRGIFENVNCYDVNSLYPSQMIRELPDPTTAQYIENSTEYLIKRYEGVSYIEGFVNYSYIPYLPMRRDLKLIFPYGTIKGYYTHFELRNMLRMGFNLHKIGDGVYYYRNFKPFKQFILDLYKLRLEYKAANNPMELMIKLIMNNLYGKFGFNFKECSKILNLKNLNKKDLDLLLNLENIELHGDMIVVKEDGKTEPTNYSFPILSSYITAYARDTMFQSLRKKRIQEKIAYMDTDSLFLIDGYKIPQSDRLGEFKFEYNCDTAEFVKPKFYKTKYIKIKGCSRVTDFETIIENKTYEQDRFIRIRSALNSKETHKFGVVKPNQIVSIKSRLNLEDTKRKWATLYDRKPQDSTPLMIQ